MSIEIVIPLKVLIFGGYVKVREKSLYTRFFIWVSTILNHNDTRAILPRFMIFYGTQDMQASMLEIYSYRRFSGFNQNLKAWIRKRYHLFGFREFLWTSKI